MIWGAAMSAVARAPEPVMNDGQILPRTRRKSVAVLELIAYTVASEWASLIAVPVLKRQTYSIMPQIVSAWCRQLGHRVTYATYYGQCEPVDLLPPDLDVLFIAGSTQTSALGYALAKLYRAKGVLTVGGGPHAKCFPEDCARFFDITVTSCDRTVIADILTGHIDPPAIVSARNAVHPLPSVEERLDEIRIAAFGKSGRPRRTSVISLYGSIGCPYTCSFCTDWNSTYAPIPPDQLAADLNFISTHFPEAVLGFQDPNFGVRFDETMDVLESLPKPRRNPYIMQCSLSVLTPQRMHRLKGTNCLYVAPGVESWSEFGNKMRLTSTRGVERVERIASQFTALNRHVPGQQANFIMGLDTDSGDLPFELTLDFLRRTPFVWPNINILTPYGGTPVFNQLMRENRLLRAMPLALFCSPYLAVTLKNYDALGFYMRFVRLLEASVSSTMSLRRAVLPDHVLLKVGRFAQTIAVRRDIHEMRTIRDARRHDTGLRNFHAGRSGKLPDIYRHHLQRRMGRFSALLTEAECQPVFNEVSTAAA